MLFISHSVSFLGMWRKAVGRMDGGREVWRWKMPKEQFGEQAVREAWNSWMEIGLSLPKMLLNTTS